MNLFRICLVTSMAILMSIGPAQAAQDVHTSDTVVSATRTQRNLSEVSSSLSVVPKKEIERHGYSSLADILQDVPGVEVTDQSLAGSKRINIRGESGSRVIIMIDGQKITEQKSMDGAPLLMDANEIERIEVLKGPASVLYGSEAIGGAVNVITKKGGDKPIQGKIGSAYNTATQGYEAHLSLSGGLEDFYYRLGGTRSEQGDRDTPSGTLEESDSDTKTGTAVLGYETQKLSLGLRLENFETHVDSPPTTVGGSPFDLNLPEWSRQKAGVTAELKEMSTILPKLHLDAYAQKTEKDFEQEMTLPMMGGIDQKMTTYNEQATQGGTLQADIIPHPDHYIVAGYTLTRDQLDARSTTKYTPQVPPTFTNKGKFHDANITTHALFAQDEWILPKDFILTLGTRQTWVTSELKATDDPDANTGSVNDSQPVFSAGITWNGIKDLTLRGHVAQGYRFPDLNKLFVGTNHGGSTTLPNPDLKPETSNNFEIGTRFNNGAWDLDLAAFYSRAKDYITTRDVAGGSNKIFANVSKAQTHGVELALRYHWENLTPYASGTWMRRKYETATASTWDTLTPEFSGRLGLRYERRLSQWPVLVWGDMFMRAATDADFKELDAGSITSHEAWQTLNLALGTEFGKTGQYRLSLNLNNILDQSYSTAQSSLEEAGFHAVARMDIQF